MLLQVSDRGAGLAPIVDADSETKQVAYFVNEHQQQLIYVFDIETSKAILYRGDNWENALAVDLLPTHCGMQLSKGELLWLESCTEISRAIIEHTEE